MVGEAAAAAWGDAAAWRNPGIPNAPLIELTEECSSIGRDTVSSSMLSRFQDRHHEVPI